MKILKTNCLHYDFPCILLTQCLKPNIKDFHLYVVFVRLTFCWLELLKIVARTLEEN